jgi:GMP synthase (glutamine-hydrolysing)
MTKRGDIKALLIQIREDERVKKEELESFAKYAQLNIDQFSSHNVFEIPIFDKCLLDGIDLLFIGGASEASVSDPVTYPFVESIKRLMLDSIDLEIPTFASCFGFQAAVLAFGGEIIKDTVNFEMGTYPITITDLAKTDPVYKNTPNGFYAVSVHQEKATQLPKNCELLAFTDDCCHSFKVRNKPFWAFQFHPELDKDCLKERLGIYKEKYTENAEQFQTVIDSIQETKESNNLVKNFVDHFTTNFSI